MFAEGSRLQLLHGRVLHKLTALDCTQEEAQVGRRAGLLGIASASLALSSAASAEGQANADAPRTGEVSCTPHTLSLVPRILAASNPDYQQSRQEFFEKGQVGQAMGREIWRKVSDMPSCSAVVVIYHKEK